ncbi:hypothetical protein Gogos_010162 [Gossypium gossypioides]|uniref:Protein OS-9 homolog n=1 Tax=Gossypium gossypioides TaxID=34282 RepID=A0A7J9BKE4_GOSGO|nr:hypothetical protein [Gossypium gossypioides]
MPTLLLGLLARQYDEYFHDLTGTLGRSYREPKYKIEFHSEDSPYHPDDDQESVSMPNKDGKNFLCFLPKVEKTKTLKPVTQQNVSSMIVESEKQVKLKTPDELLEVLKDRCFIRLFSMQQEGWWSYEFCYQNRLRQIHVEEDKVVQEFILGVYDEEATAAFNQNLSDISTLKDPRSKDASQRYHAHQYTNGTQCDLTNQPRETEVRFVCSEPRAMISSITELSTCKYALTIQSPMLCKHPYNVGMLREKETRFSTYIPLSDCITEGCKLYQLPLGSWELSVLPVDLYQLFQEERPVWHTINCNVLPKDTKVEEDPHITMIMDSEDQSSNFDSSQ